MSVLPEGWVETYLGPLCNKIGSGATPRGGNEAYKETGISLIRSQNILDFDFAYKGLAFIDEAQASKLDNVTVSEDDVLINITGDSVARVCQVPNEVLPARVNQHVAILRANTEKLTPSYLKYYLLNPIFKRFLLKLAHSGGTRNALTKDMLESLEVNLPPLPEQESIARILSSMDDKIEVLREQNKTLETLAQTIFKEWFVHFNYPNATGDMVNSELGEIPKGWRVGNFEEIINFTNGYAFKSKELIKKPPRNNYAVFKMGNIIKGGGFNSSKIKDYMEKEKCKDLKKYILRKGDVLMCMTDMKDSTSLLGHTALLFENDRYIVNQRVGLIRAQNDLNIDYPWIYILTNSLNFISDLRKRANSGVQINLSTNEIKCSPIIIPDKNTNALFDELAKPIFEKVGQNNTQIQTLSKTRDTLLPKLMSGAVRVEGN